MASILKVDALQGVTAAGSILVTGEGNSTTTNLQQGLAKAWGRVGLAGTQVLNSSFNVSGITDIGAGQTQWTLINSFSDTSYNPVISSDNSSGATPARFGGRDGSQATGSYRGICSTTNNGETDGSLFSCVFGDLA